MRTFSLRWNPAFAGAPAWVFWAGGFFERLRGLLFSHPLPEGFGLWFPGCTSIHTFGMNRPLDVAFLTAEGQVLAVHHAVAPWRVLAAPRGACATLECEAGVLRRATPGAVVTIHSAEEFPLR